ncbi:MAG: thymidine kinase [Devosiaceae bacterium]|nr:thymidine kinase [Devosiaceae bacterium]
MAKLYFSYAAMNAGKSTLLLQASHNYRERGMNTLLFTAALDDRAGVTTIASRIGLKAKAELFSENDNLFSKIKTALEEGEINCIFVDEAQFLTKQQVWQLARVADRLGVPIMCYGLRTDFQGKLFPGSSELLAIADVLREIRTICHCGSKATMVVRLGEDGAVLIEGDQVAIGGNERYVSLCRKHWEEKTGSWPTDELDSPTLELEPKEDNKNE